MIATCGADEKIPLLKRLGCDRVINYKKENLNEVLRKEYPKGYDYFFFLYLSSFYISLLFLVLFALLSLLFTSFYLCTYLASTLFTSQWEATLSRYEKINTKRY